MVNPYPGESEILFSNENIRSAVHDLGLELSTRLSGKNLLVLGILKGAFIFTADLCRELQIPLEIDFLTLSSYGKSLTSSGYVKILREPTIPLQNRTILVIEDIVDTGSTFHFVKEYLKRKGASEIITASLIYREKESNQSLVPDYHCFTAKNNDFLVGYGLDAGEKYRNLQDIHRLFK